MAVGPISTIVNNSLGGLDGLLNGKPLPGTGLPGPGGLPGPDSGLPGGVPIPGDPTGGLDLTPQPGLPGGDGNPLPGTSPGLPNNGMPSDFRPDSPLSRMLQGQSMQSNGNANAFSAGPTQYPPPTLSERALNVSSGQPVAMVDRPVTLSPVTPVAASQAAATQSAALPAAVPSTAASVAPNTGAQAALIGAGQSQTAAQPLAAAMAQDALAAQRNVLAHLSGPQHANPANPAAVAPPPSETGLTLPSVNTQTINNDARNLPLSGHERALQQRGDGAPGMATYTGDGPVRRGQRRGGRVDNASLTQWLWSFGRGGVHRPTHENTPDRETMRALQWLFWVLTVVAYVCLAMAIVLMLPSGSLEGGRASSGGSAIALMLGVCVAAGAWWLGRRLNRR